ncbi:MAG: glycosyltransferase family 2 protein [Anaerolineales bacterium]|nr:glycosyltransferase family 2 protein [Anaerolineales bacterium]
MTNPLVSVIIPAYNAQDFIAQTIESVIKQTYSHWELCIVDDGSTDDTAKIIQSYSSDNRIKYLYQQNQERAAARNHGLRCSSGRYVAFLDADDLWLPDKLKAQVQFLENQPAPALCFTQNLYINEQGLVTGKAGIAFKPGSDQFSRLLEGNFIANSTVMVPRTVFDKIGFF